jgi:hypothetical protein
MFVHCCLAVVATCSCCHRAYDQPEKVPRKSQVIEHKPDSWDTVCQQLFCVICDYKTVGGGFR